MSEIELISRIFGSRRAVAAALGVGRSAVSNWRHHGIPDAQKWRLLLLARERGLQLEAEDLGLPPRAGEVPEQQDEENRLEEAA